MPQSELERLMASRSRNFKINRRYMDRARTQVLGPGTGLFLPARAPHYVRNGDGVSISASLTFGTKAASADRAVLSVNHRLRKIGLKPRPPGDSAASDSLKAAALRGLGGASRVVRKR